MHWWKSRELAQVFALTNSVFAYLMCVKYALLLGEELDAMDARENAFNDNSTGTLELILIGKTEEVAQNQELVNSYCKNLLILPRKHCHDFFKIPFTEYNKASVSDPTKPSYQYWSCRLIFEFIIFTLELGMNLYVLTEPVEDMTLYKCVICIILAVSGQMLDLLVWFATISKLGITLSNGARLLWNMAKFYFINLAYQMTKVYHVEWPRIRRRLPGGTVIILDFTDPLDNRSIYLTAPSA